MLEFNANVSNADQIAQLENYVRDYCQTHGISDPEVYLSSLDGQKTVDSSILQGPVYEAYLQLAYLKLFEVVDPATSCSTFGAVESPSNDQVQNFIDSETLEVLESLLQDNPQFIAFVAQTYGETEDARDILNALNSYVAPESQQITTMNQIQQVTTLPQAETQEDFDFETQYTDDQARDLANQFGLNGMWDWMIETEEGKNSSTAYFFSTLSESDLLLTELEQAFSDGTISSEGFQTKFEQISSNRQLSLAMIQNVENSFNNILSLFSSLIKSESEALSQLANNIGRGS